MVRPPKPPPKAQIPPFGMGRLLAAARAAVNIVSKEIVAFGQSEADIMKRRIGAQRFDSFKAHPLAKSTLEKKALYGRSLRVMISTKSYVDNIRPIVRQTRGGGLVVTVGFPNRLRARDTVTGRPRPGVSMSRVAFWQEYGAKRARIPARPHWGPALEAARKRSPAMRARTRGLAVAAFLRTLRNRG